MFNNRIGKEQTIPVNSLTESQTGGADSKIIGRHNLRITGTVKINCDCSWTFTGDMSSDQGYDIYNFNRSNRDTSAEAQTTIGRTICNGKKFNIFINGSKNLSISGKTSGEPTCCKK